ncbi:MAG: LysM domain-containing protein, partial [Dehalococcoidia bacterium]
AIAASAAVIAVLWGFVLNDDKRSTGLEAEAATLTGATAPAEEGTGQSRSGIEAGTLGGAVDAEEAQPSEATADQRSAEAAESVAAVESVETEPSDAGSQPPAAPEPSAAVRPATETDEESGEITPVAGGSIPDGEPDAGAGNLTWTVQAGDTLEKIAAESGTTIEELAELNELENANEIVVGQVLLIPDS